METLHLSSPHLPTTGEKVCPPPCVHRPEGPSPLGKAVQEARQNGYGDEPVELEGPNHGSHVMAGISMERGNADPENLGMGRNQPEKQQCVR